LTNMAMIGHSMTWGCDPMVIAPAAPDRVD
jgi:hypothetical protein